MLRCNLSAPLVLALLTASLALPAAAAEGDQPNVIVVITDDQGYGDIGAHGNEHIHTPNMDRLHEQSVRLENFHVDPTCAPTRAALLTGRYSGRVGVWHTVMGRSLLRADERVMAEYFADAGYRTGVFGKWHLGETYPYAPRFRGFDTSVIHGGGGVGQAPDYWGNTYFDDHYMRNGDWEAFEGYCTDVFFDEALSFIEANRDDPFFVYLPTNAPHSPYRAPEEDIARYTEAGIPEPQATFWAMITNIDTNLGRLMGKLDDWQLAEDTILIFMTDNGTAAGVRNQPTDDGFRGYSAGLRGRKGSFYEGGHRVPFFLRYPAADFEHDRAIDTLTSHIDLLPTLIELCNLDDADVAFDGTSLVPLLHGDIDDWPDRTLVVESQRIMHPEKWRQTSVMTDRYRLINNRELYDMTNDRGQQNNIIDDHPEVADRLRTFYDGWWDDLSESHARYTPLYLGAEQENPVTLSSHDWHIGGLPPWHQNHVRNRQAKNGRWSVNVVREGRYAITLRERPAAATEADFKLPAEHAKVAVGDVEAEMAIEPKTTEGARFELTLPAGRTTLQTWLTDPDGTTRGAYYVTVEYIGE